jgi:hypothetical protein
VRTTRGCAGVAWLLACTPAVRPAVAPEVAPGPAAVAARPEAAPEVVPEPAAAAAAPALAEAEAPGDDEAPALAAPADVPVVAGMKIIEVARISADVGDSPDGGTYLVVRGELRAIAAAWLAEAQRRGFKVLAERFTDDVHVASLDDGAGRRAHLLLQRSGDGELAGMFNYGKQRQVALKGRCVAVPQREREFEVDYGRIAHGGGYDGGLVLVQRVTELGHDFDGDGELDVLVPTTDRASCPHEVQWTVYLSRGECAHAVGTVGPGELVAWTEWKGTGPRALEFSSETAALGDGGVVKTAVATRHEFDGRKYRRVKRTPSKGVCHHCAWETCKPIR